MLLNKPPVIQTWISFTFRAGIEKTGWNEKRAREFLNKYTEYAKHVNILKETTLLIEEGPSDRLPEVVNREVTLIRLRARNEASKRWVQIADDQMIVNVLRGGSEAPNYQELRHESLDKFDDYVKFFRPSSLERAELHYVDIIEIPIPSDQKIEPSDYFNLRIEIPEGGGIDGVSYFSFRVVLRPPDSDDSLEVSFESEPPVPGSGSFRFRLDWHMTCSDLGGLDREVIGQRLDRAHDCVLAYFKASVTDKTWQLFEPAEQG